MTTGKMRGAAILIAAGMLFAAGCAAPQSPALRQTYQDYAAAETDPPITQRASVTLFEARQALESARKARSREEQLHYTYLAGQRIALARIQAQQLQSQQELEILEERQNKVLADLRRRQSEEARRDAEQAQQELKEYLREERPVQSEPAE